MLDGIFEQTVDAREDFAFPLQVSGVKTAVISFLLQAGATAGLGRRIHQQNPNATFTAEEIDVGEDAGTGLDARQGQILAFERQHATEEGNVLAGIQSGLQAGYVVGTKIASPLQQIASVVDQQVRRPECVFVQKIDELANRPWQFHSVTRHHSLRQSLKSLLDAPTGLGAGGGHQPVSRFKPGKFRFIDAPMLLEIYLIQQQQEWLFADRRFGACLQLHSGGYGVGPSAVGHEQIARRAAQIGLA